MRNLKRVSVRKNQKNIVPFFYNDVVAIQNIIEELKQDGLLSIDTNFTTLLAAIFWKFKRANQPPEHTFTKYRLRLQLHNSRIYNEEISDRMAMGLLHLHNKVLGFIPENYPKLLIDTLLEQQKDTIDHSIYFEDLKTVENIFAPLTVPMVIKLAELLGIRREGMFRLFSDVLETKEQNLLGHTAQDKRSNVDYPHQNYQLRKQWCEFLKLFYMAGLISKRGEIFIPINEQTTQYNPLLDPINLDEEQRKRYYQNLFYPPYITMRLWYSLGKNLGLCDIAEVRQAIDVAIVEQKEKYREVILNIINTYLAKNKDSKK